MNVITKRVDCPNPKCKDGRINRAEMGRKRVEWKSSKCQTCNGKGKITKIRGT